MTYINENVADQAIAHDPVIGTGPQSTTAQTIMSSLAQIAYNVKSYGAKGDGVTDDTTAIQNALNDANTKGGFVFIPAGTYIVSSPLTINWSSTSKITGIYGVGNQSIIQGTLSLANRAILELLGSSNTLAVNMVIKDFEILMNVGSNTQAYCLRVGDARNFKAERINCFGANGLLLKISSSTSYAQINTNFKQCRFISNDSNRFFSNDNLATVFAVKVETGGALWDNVHFESCDFVGLVETRAWICEFDNCQFSTNPNRPYDSSYNYAYNINTTIGNLTCRNCYFEDHQIAVFISNATSHVYNVNLEDCHFSGVTNYGVNGTFAVRIAEAGGTNKIGTVSISRCKFGGGTNAYSDSIVKTDSNSAIVIVDSPINLNNPTASLTMKGNIIAKNREWVKFKGTITAVNGVAYAVLANTSNVSYYYVDAPCWISRVKYIQDAKTTAGNQTIGVYLNGSPLISEVFTTSALFTNKSVDSGMDEGTIFNPNSLTKTFAKGDKINVHVNTDGTFAPLNTYFEVWIELAY